MSLVADAVAETRVTYLCRSRLPHMPVKEAISGYLWSQRVFKVLKWAPGDSLMDIDPGLGVEKRRVGAGLNPRPCEIIFSRHSDAGLGQGMYRTPGSWEWLGARRDLAFV